jgi:hypothetical protein
MRDMTIREIHWGLSAFRLCYYTDIHILPETEPDTNWESNQLSNSFVSHLHIQQYLTLVLTERSY